MNPPQSPSAGDEPWLEVLGSRDFPAWLRAQKVSLAFSTYETGKLFMVGVKGDDRLAVFERNFQRCMGLWSTGSSLWMSTLFQLWRLENVLGPGDEHNGHDALYVPRVAHTTGDIDVHDLAIDAQGRVIFANTKFNCLATLDERQSFAPLWRPPFISRLTAEDRCHLNGLALVDGVPRYMTIVGPADVVDGWRDHRQTGGCVLELPSGRVVCAGLSMPHSPRWYRDRLWVHNSGTGEFGWVDLDRGAFQPVCFAPGYLRGLAFVDRWAIMTLSKSRREATFNGLAIDDRLREKQTEARCGIQVVDLVTGEVPYWLRINGVVTELYDVAVLGGVQRPMALGFKTDDIQRLITVAGERMI
ncbi:MAG: TIGR03032 family protein [Planctomycetaceae bacterium]|nr:TIGR03032 family protein [Planctomycetaceae bacterium]